MHLLVAWNVVIYFLHYCANHKFVKMLLANGILRIKFPGKGQSGTTMRATKGYWISGYSLMSYQTSATK